MLYFHIVLSRYKPYTIHADVQAQARRREREKERERERQTAKEIAC
jgi:hypothetical protein